MTGRARGRRVDTPQGPAEVRLHRAEGPGGGTLVLGHGAGAGVETADLQALVGLVSSGWTVALVQQPWRVAGRRVATSAPTLDAATTAVLSTLRHGRWRVPEPVVLGGRSAGARVACRLAGAVGAAGVVALAFPLYPPGRPERSRADELLAPVRDGIPTLVVQGARDPFGGPREIRSVLAGRAARVVEVPGDHGPTRDLPTLRDAVSDFLDGLRLSPAAGPSGRAQEPDTDEHPPPTRSTHV
ncbi:alpha/beta hydrolase family protein [Ornithinimicrobium sediminis]|uniref:alpha/beta hydrolase family protein n=1 Tax=Ornithinimicrobium sediminis TaxID=2904603 RepID=UPI001E5483BC|nr:hypothetical protein [Ornithinimicrobium sediminis]